MEDTYTKFVDYLFENNYELFDQASENIGETSALIKLIDFIPLGNDVFKSYIKYIIDFNMLDEDEVPDFVREFCKEEVKPIMIEDKVIDWFLDGNMAYEVIDALEEHCCKKVVRSCLKEIICENNR